MTVLPCPDIDLIRQSRQGKPEGGMDMTGGISESGDGAETRIEYPGKVSIISRCLRTPVKRCLDFLYPPGCPCCGSAISEPHALCARCWGEIRFIERPYCERLGTPLPVHSAERLFSPAAIANPPVFNRARAAVCYDKNARALVHRFKYGDRPELARLMGRLMAVAGKEILQEADLILPVPLHRWRLWRRRFNHAMELAAAIAQHSGLTCDPFILARIRGTRPQNELTKAQRRENLTGAFAVSDEARMLVQGKNIILIDDVLTTGATANAAAHTLMRAGASNIDVLTFASVVID